MRTVELSALVSNLCLYVCLYFREKFADVRNYCLRTGAHTELLPGHFCFRGASSFACFSRSNSIRWSCTIVVFTFCFGLSMFHSFSTCLKNRVCFCLSIYVGGYSIVLLSPSAVCFDSQVIFYYFPVKWKRVCYSFLSDLILFLTCFSASCRSRSRCFVQNREEKGEEEKVRAITDR